jgi:hypothetical protein
LFKISGASHVGFITFESTNGFTNLTEVPKSDIYHELGKGGRQKRQSTGGQGKRELGVAEREREGGREKGEHKGERRGRAWHGRKGGGREKERIPLHRHQRDPRRRGVCLGFSCPSGL